MVVPSPTPIMPMSFERNTSTRSCGRRYFTAMATRKPALPPPRTRTRSMMAYPLAEGRPVSVQRCRADHRLAREPPQGSVGDLKGDAERGGQLQQVVFQSGFGQPGPQSVQDEGRQAELWGVNGNDYRSW